MAAALFRRGTGLCCIHRELCRLVWRPQTAPFSSKPSDRKQSRRTHIKKAKPQPAVDVAKLLEQLFSQRRPGTLPPAGQARPAKASSSMPTKPPTTSSMKVFTSNVPPLSKTEPAMSVFPAASSFKQVDGVPTSTLNSALLSPQPKSVPPTNPKTSHSSETPQQSQQTVPTAGTTPASSGSEAAAIEIRLETNVETAPEFVEELKTATVLPLSAHMLEKNVETSSFSAATVEPLMETTTESLAEPSLSPVKTLEVRAAVVEGSVEPTVDAPAEEVPTKSTDSGVADVSHTAKEEPSVETTIESPVEASLFPMETLETRAAVAEGPLAPTTDVTAQKVPTKSTDIATVEPLLETTVEPPVETSTFPLETLECRAAVAGCPVETTIEAEADTAAQAVQTNSTDSGAVNASYSAKEEPLIETTIEPAVEASTSPLESRAAVSEGTMEPTIENESADNLLLRALIQNAQESAPLPLKNEVESTVESSSGHVAVEEELKKSEQMTLESVTLHAVTVLVELLQTKSILDEKAEKQLQELSVQTWTGDEYKAAAETENSSEDKSEILTKVLSKWDSMSDNLQELEGESGTLVKELLCHVPAVLSKTPGTVKTSSDPPVGANGDSLQLQEKGTEAQATTLESITLAKVKAEVGGLETKVLLETRTALEKEAEVFVIEEKMEVMTIEDVDVFEDTTEADILTLDSISEATVAIEAETAVILEAMFGSEQGPRQPPDTLLVEQKLGQQDEAIGPEAEKESMEAMTLESVTLAEVKASLGTLENESLSETTAHLEKEAESLAEEKRMEVEDGVASEETTEALKIEALSLSESEALQADALMAELLFSVPGHVTGVAEGPIGQEVVRANTLDDLDPVQRLFLEKIREYDNIRRLNGGLLEAEPDYEKCLSEETAKLERLYGGGDLSSFPEFTFTEPKMDQDSK